MTANLEATYLQPTAPASGAVDFHAPDLTRHPPRSPRARLGGYIYLPRLIDKARAVAGGRAGDYHFGCPFDRRFFAFTGIEAEAFMAEVKSGRGDGELLAYIHAQARPARAAHEIVAWSNWLDQLVPTSPDGRTFFNDVHRKNAPQRDDIATWFDWLELDDFVSFGGRP